MIIKLVSKTDNNHKQEHFIFKPSIAPESCRFTLTEIEPSFSQLLDQHKEAYSTSINIPEWREVIWATNTPIESLDMSQIALKYSTSFEAQAIRAGLETDTKTLGLVALIKTNDDFFVFGLRTGLAMGGYLCNAPAGHCAPEQPGNNPILDGFLEELASELAITAEEIGSPELLGYQTDPDFGRGVNLVIYASTHLSFLEIAMRHKQAFDVASKARNAGQNYTQIKDAIKNAGLINIDAHEHDLLVAIPAQEKALEDLIQHRKFAYQDMITASSKTTEAPLLDIARGSLLMYQEYKSHSNK